MRIRKRAVPLPLSLLSPVPLPPSDPRLVQLPAGFLRSDHHPPEVRLGYEHEMNKDQRGEIPHPSKEIDSGAIAVSDLSPLPLPATPSAHEKVAPVDGRWCDGDKSIPLKKRKASFEMNGMVVSEGESRMKSKTNKKCLNRDNDNEDDEDEDEDDDYSVDDYDDPISSDDNKKKRKKTAKKKKKGVGARKKACTGTNTGAGTGGAGKSKKKKKKGEGVMQEGSRCSRVNGRGWRCMQPTLVGYSLCEHHLGKGRLRSMSSVRAANPNPNPNPTGNGATKTKRRRIGMVKARSLSSLLCQPNTSVVVQLGSTTTTATT